MKKIISLTVILLLFSLSSCSIKTSYDYMHDTQDIVEVHIATFYWDDQMNLCHDEIKKIDDIDAFLRDFNELNCYKWQGDPCGLLKENEGNYIIKFLYSNGDYELIDWLGIAKYTINDDRLRNYRGYRRFDEIPFKEFTQKYSN